MLVSTPDLRKSEKPIIEKNIFVNEILSSVAKKSDQVQDTHRGLHFWTLLEICVLQET